MKTVFAVAGVIEILAGLAFVITPSLPAEQIFGTALEGPGPTSLGRLVGLALLALGVAFWHARNDVRSPAARGLAVTVLGYNAAVALMAVASGVGRGLSAPGLWPAIVVHTGMAGWCAWSLRADQARSTVDQL